MNKRPSFAMAFARPPRRARAKTAGSAEPRQQRATAGPRPESAPPRSRIGAYARAAKRLAPRRKTDLCAALLIAAGAALRLWAIGDLPAGVHIDEASGAYDAWALLHYGIDRNGDPWPVHFIAWGSGLNALYPYIAMPFIWFAGLDITAYRLPMALSGIASLWLMWRVAHNAAGPKFALIPLLLLALSPLHIMANRWAIESNILPFTILLSVYFLSRHDRHRFAIQAAAIAALSLSVYAYATAYLFAPLFLAAAFGWLALNRALTLRRAVALAAIAAALTAPMIAFIIVNIFDLDAIRILGATIPRYTGPPRYETRAFLLQGDWSGFTDNLENLWRLLRGVTEENIAAVLHGWGALPRYSIIIAAAGLGVAAYRAIARRDFSPHLIVAIWLVLALAVSAFSDVLIRRMNLIWMPALYLTALGLASACRPRAALCAAIAAAIALGGVFAQQYFAKYETLASQSFRRGLDAAITQAIQTAGENETIYISQRINHPYIHALYVSAAPPRQYLETRIVDNPNGHYQEILAFGRFVFLSPFQPNATAPQPGVDAAPGNEPRDERRYQHLRTAGINIDRVEHYIFKIPAETAAMEALAANGYAVERHGIFAYARPKDAHPKDSAPDSPGNAGSIRAAAPLIQGEPDARAKFNLHIQDRELIYFKRPCDPYDTRQPFFLRVIPENISDLPEERRARGFDSLDFSFEEYGALYGSQCLARVPLPQYPIAAIETGQTNPTREWPLFWRQSSNTLWSAELQLPPPPSEH